YVIACDEVVRDASGSVVELRCTYDPATKSGSDTSGRRVKGTIHWVSVEHALDAEVRLYDRLFRVANPDGGEEDFKSHLNPDSLVIVEGAKVEPSVAGDPTDTRYQFTRNGYFWRDSDSTPDRLVFNRIVTLRDSWAKQREAEPEKAPAKRSAPVVTEGPSAEELLAERLDVLDAKARVRYDAYLAEGLDAEVAILFVEDDALAQFFVDGLNAGPVDAVGLANWIANDVRRVLKDRPEAPLTGPAVAELVNLIDAGTVSHRIARDVFARMAESGGSPEAIVEAQGLKQVSDEGALVPVIDALMAEHAGKVAAYRAGKTGLKGFFIGQVMRQTGGKANPQLVQRLVGEKLAG
ncbi:MAG: glutamine--tRNA ligase, partial [Bacteroidota bacterium]